MQPTLAEVPLKNFYRFAVPTKDDFTESGELGAGASCHFVGLPQSRTLTMNLQVPEPWLVEPVVAKHDLDNLVLEKIPERSISAVFELEALMLTGHCYEEDAEPPRGLQLLLGTASTPHMEDTLVMANLGYFQLKASPAVWTLSLAAGRSAELYTLAGPGAGSDAGPSSMRVVVGDLTGRVVRLEVVKREGKEEEKILEDGEGHLDDEEEEEEEEEGWGGEEEEGGAGDKEEEEEEDDLYIADDDEDGGVRAGRRKAKGKKAGRSMWGSMMDAIKGKPPAAARTPAPKAAPAGGDASGETINIFSIASGHLYERFTRIMILSVLKHTKRPVKFWFIKNYLSPKFKDVIPHMARAYGFRYALVTYKWPSWLHKQREKQRLIWAYKILFLDVLFPLSTKKVIFVDADQIVRTDMGELYDMNLRGRPLAYTPMCDNNRQMEGYRFWKQFRQMAAGDHLRVFYESLSKDPNSLANLDQDLPNYAQHAVPIFSLPQQWLWCESWCGNETKKYARTIDLCNNPMTKEPKLEGARRIVAEWPALDEEQRRFVERLEADELDGSDSSIPPFDGSASLGDNLDVGSNSELLPEEIEEELEAARDGEQELEKFAPVDGDDVASKDEL
eukprot:jgi/Mesen1/1224/ME000129S00327